MSDFKTRRAEARAKHGDNLREKFKKIDKDNSGYASIDEMCSFLAESGAIKLGKNTLNEFQASMKHYLDNFNYDKTKDNELNETEFVNFWSDLYAIFAKIDKDGDGNIAIIECVALLDDKAEKYGLAKADLFKKVVHFFNQADVDGDRQISLIEFFIKLPQLEEFLLNKKI
jgi:Ca2+-binding EF-hand superfamily protein